MSAPPLIFLKEEKMAVLETIKIQSLKFPNRAVQINLKDFNPNIHKVWDDKMASIKVEPPPPSPPEPDKTAEKMQDAENIRAKKSAK